MLQLKNKLFQPLTLHKADGAGLHLLARGVAIITEPEMSADIRRAESRGHLTITTLTESLAVPASAPVPDAVSDEDETQSKPKKGGRR